MSEGIAPPQAEPVLHGCRVIGINLCEVKKWVTIPHSDCAPRERWVPAKQTARTSVDQLCDVFRWATIDVDEALRNDEPKRCVECKQPVRPHKAHTNGIAADFRARDEESDVLAESGLTIVMRTVR